MLDVDFFHSLMRKNLELSKMWREFSEIFRLEELQSRSDLLHEGIRAFSSTIRR